MRIVCLNKLAPDMDNQRNNLTRNVFIQDSAQLMINPESVTAAAAALAFKRDFPETEIEVVSIAPRGALPHLKDMVRRGFDRATLIFDWRYASSEARATSMILARYLRTREFDCIFCGTHTRNEGTDQVPGQVAELLGLPYLAGISAVDNASLAQGRAEVEVNSDGEALRLSEALPALLGFQVAPKRKLPYISYEDLNRDVSDHITVIGNESLKLEDSELGLAGSLTRARRVAAAGQGPQDTVFLQSDAAGIEVVYRFLERQGFLPSGLDDSGARQIKKREKAEERDIRESKILISGGGGVLRDFPLLEKLAEALHGMVSASRRAVDNGMAPRSIQVGQTGKSVSPRLYIALGISGSIQHIAGLRNAEYIIAVNKNKHAPICSRSDIVVEGDAREFVEGLLARIEAARMEAQGAADGAGGVPPRSAPRQMPGMKPPE